MKKLVTLLIFLFVTGCNTNTKTSLPQVVTSFYTLSFFAEQIGGDAIQVQTLTPETLAPHDYFIETEKLKQLEASDLIIAQGGTFETWSEELYRGELLDNEAFPLIFSHEMEFTLNENEQMDSHIWLDPVLAKQMVDLIVARLVSLAPEYESEFTERSNLLKTELDVLHAEFEAGLATCQTKDLIVSHDAFSYFAARYGLTFHPILNTAHADEPSLEELIALTDFAKTNNLKYLFVETLSNPEVAETLAAEAGLELLVLNPLEGRTEAEKATGGDYFSIMRTNLNNLKIGLSCP